MVRQSYSQLSAFTVSKKWQEAARNSEARWKLKKDLNIKRREMNEWINEWVNEWNMSEMNKGMNEWMKHLLFYNRSNI